MRRAILTVLCISLMAAAFAADGSDVVELTLEANVQGGLFHGFSTMDSTDSDMARLNISAGNVGDQLRTGLDLESSEAQAVGYYNLLTTGAAQASVSFTLNPLSATIGSTTYYVPFLLTYEDSHGTGNVKVTGSSLGSDEEDWTNELPEAVSGTVLSTQSSGLRWKTLELTVTFNGDANGTLPESDAYSGTVVAAVTTE